MASEKAIQSLAREQCCTQTGMYMIGNGHWKNGEKCGEGKMSFSKHKSYKEYEGNWKSDKMEGKCKLSFVNGGRYKGDVKAGKMHGKGTFWHANGTKHEGVFNYDNVRVECFVDVLNEEMVPGRNVAKSIKRARTG